MINSTHNLITLLSPRRVSDENTFLVWGATALTWSAVYSYLSYWRVYHLKRASRWFWAWTALILTFSLGALWPSHWSENTQITGVCLLGRAASLPTQARRPAASGKSTAPAMRLVAIEKWLQIFFVQREPCFQSPLNTRGTCLILWVLAMPQPYLWQPHAISLTLN